MTQAQAPKQKPSNPSTIKPLLKDALNTAKIYSIELKNVTIDVIKNYGPKVKNAGVHFVKTYVPKAIDATVNFTKTYAPKVKDASVHFVKTYGPKVKDASVNFVSTYGPKLKVFVVALAVKANDLFVQATAFVQTKLNKKPDNKKPEHKNPEHKQAKKIIPSDEAKHLKKSDETKLQ